MVQDDYSNFSCAWCGISAIWKERVEKVIGGTTYSVCSWCGQFDSKVDRDEQTFEYFNYLIYQVLIGELDRSVYTGV